MVVVVLLLGLYPAAVPKFVVAARQWQHKGRTSRNRGEWPRDGSRVLLRARAGRGAHEGMQAGCREDGRSDC